MDPPPQEIVTELKNAPDDDADNAPEAPEPQVVNPSESATEPSCDATPEPHQDYQIGDFVVAKYNGNSYIGKIIDLEDREIQITFIPIPRHEGHFRWPTSEDIIWVYLQNIIGKIAPPVAKGRFDRSFLLGEADRIFTLDD